MFTITIAYPAPERKIRITNKISKTFIIEVRVSTKAETHAAQ